MYRNKMNLLKRSRIMVLSGFTMLLYGTAFFQREIPENEAVIVSSDFIWEKSNAIELTGKVYEKNYYNTNNKLCLSLVYRYPHINGNGDNINEINRQIEEQRDKWIASQQDLINNAKEQDLICGTNGNEVNYGVTYNKNDVLSILFEGYLYAGGAHGMPYRMPQTFRVSTGKPMSLEEVSGMTKEEVIKRVNEKFQELYAKNPDNFWNNATELVSKIEYKDFSYYVEQDGVHIYFDPYFVAPYAAGFIEIIL